MQDDIKGYDLIISSTHTLTSTIAIYPKVYTDKEFQYLHKFYDKFLYLLLNHRDLCIGLKYLDITNASGNTLETNYFARILALTCHEILNEIQKLTGKEIREHAKELLGESGLEEIDNSLRLLGQVRKEKIKYLKEIRHNLIGHKMEHASKQSDLIKNIDIKEIYKIGDRIFGIQMELINKYSKLVQTI